jgi:squalene monooxygenase
LQHADADGYDVCIVGAGVGGAALGAYLGHSGFHVAIVERSWSEPEEIIGELLQPGGLQKLEELGLDTDLEQFDAQALEGYSLYHEQDNFSLAYPGNPISHGYGFRYGRFVTHLRRGVRRVADCFEGRVSGLEQNKEGTITGVRYAPGNGGETRRILSRLTVLSPGASSNLRKHISSGKPEITGYMLGTLIDVKCLPRPGHGHVFIADPAPVLAYPVSSTEARLLIDFPQRRSPEPVPARKDSPPIA